MVEPTNIQKRILSVAASVTSLRANWMSFHNDQAYSLEFRLYERYLTVYVYVNLYIPTADAYVQSKLSVMQKKFCLFKHWSFDGESAQ